MLKKLNEEERGELLRWQWPRIFEPTLGDKNIILKILALRTSNLLTLRDAIEAYEIDDAETLADIDFLYHLANDEFSYVLGNL